MLTTEKLELSMLELKHEGPGTTENIYVKNAQRSKLRLWKVCE